jgi:predicted O-linked N-acetylglucosamine transferase (SPINDLY family)/SAM-dependent methyltransferase
MSLSLKSLPQTESDHLYVLFNNGRYSDLERRTRELIEQYPDSGVAWKALGASLQMQGKEALLALKQAAEMLPDDAAAQSNLGRELRSLGELDAAAMRFRRALAAKPDFADAHNNLGAVLQDLGQLDEAVTCYRRAVEINPDFVDAHANLGRTLLDLGQLHDAEASFRRAIEINPELVVAHNRLGVVLRHLGQLDAAAASHRRALEIDPDHAAAHNNLGIVLQGLGQFDAAMASYRRALEIDPDIASPHINMGCVLEDLWRLDDAVASFRRALEIDADSIAVRSSLLSLQHYMVGVPAANLLAEARQFGDLVAQQAFAYTDWANSPEPQRCLRIGMVSPDFHHHPVGHFLESILMALASNAAGRLELVAYATNTHSDAVTERIKSSCHAWHSAIGLSDESLARQIRDDGIDILIDLSGHTVHNRLSLFAWKPAPVQVSWLGYFATTGLAAMDYLIADPWTLPESEEANFTEKIWRLPETRLCFTAPDVDIDISPLPARTNGHITFGCFQNPNKINDAVVELWARVLKAVPGSSLLFKTKQLDNAEVRQRTKDRFAANGIEADCLMFEGFSPRVDYLAAYRRVDIVLDTFPFPGGTTTVESMWMGVPVLTRAGTSFLARQGLGLLMNAGLTDWIAADDDDFVARAVSHAGDLPRLAALREGLRQQVVNSPIFDAPRFAGHFEAALRGMWRTWCSQKHLPVCRLPQVETEQLVAMFNAGRYPELEALTRSLIDLDPDLGIAWKFLGASLQVQGNDALLALQRAAEFLPDDAEAHNNLGVALIARGESDAAIASFHRALGVDSGYVAALCSLGAILNGLGRFEEAAASLRRALQINPDDADTHSYLGNVLTSLGKLDKAVASYRLALEIRPDFVEAQCNLGVALHSLGQFDEAVESYRRALEINPEFAGAHTNLGVSLVSLGQFEEAVVCHRRAVEIDSSNATAHYNLGVALQALGQFDDAVVSFRRALKIRPEVADAHLRLGDVLNELGRPESALVSYRCALQIKPDLLNAHSNILFTHHYLFDQSAEMMLAQARRYGYMVEQQARPYANYPNIPAHNRLLRVGLVSGDLRDHPVGHFIEGVLSALSLNSREQLSLIAYANHSVSDPLAERIKSSCLIWRSVVGLSDESLARQIRDDGIDILIDLSGHTGQSRLPVFAWKPAPVQVSWLGYFATTGLAAMDYLIADPWTLPESEEVNFTEKIWRLPETRLCFTAPDMDINISPLPALNTGHITFGCFQSLNKINDAVVMLWARVLKAVPGSRLLLKAKLYDEVRVRQSVADRFAASGIEAGRLVFEGASPRAEYLAAYQRVDIVLDTAPYPGGTTTAESLWMGVPVLTLTGTSFLARQGLGLLMNAGLPDWIAADADDYVARGVAQAGDLPRLAALRTGLRQQVLTSPIFDPPRFAGCFETALRGMWMQWCDEQSDVTKHESEPHGMKTFLHVGCGPQRKDRTTRGFNVPDWKELRLDIDPSVNPDIVGTTLDMSAVADGSMDALFSKHNIEHLYAHEVPLALAEFRRVLKPDGFLVITCPDLQSVCQLIADDKLVEPAYNSPAGPIAPLDILYGLRESLEQGNHYMAHRCGFTEKVLVGTLQEAEFGSVVSGSRAHPYYDLWAVATKSVQSEEELAVLADAHFPPEDESVDLPQTGQTSLEQLSSFSSHTYWGVSDRTRFAAVMEEAKSLVAPGFFLGDNLFTWCRNNSLLEDAAFRHAWESNIQNNADEAIVWRRYILACAAYHCVRLKGDFVECGVYSGTGIKTVMDYLGGTAFPKTFWGYDTYDYHPIEGHQFDDQQEGFYETVKERFADYPQVNLIKGFLPDSFADGIPEGVAYLHIDLNNAAGELATLEHLFDRVVSGGIIIMDDYEWAGVYRKQKLAEDPWFAERNYRVFPLPTGQGLILKR